MSTTPYLSLVACSRNDDHGGNLLNRMQLFVRGFLEQCRRHQLRAELILVEWNPPAERPRLKDALSWPVEGGACDVRIIEVPPEIHRRFKNSDRLPLFQMIAKNVGIRRARGEFILATNIDILFSDDIMQFFTSGKMKPRRLYRVDRYDVPANVPEGLDIREQLEFCRNNVIRVHARRRTQDLLYIGNRMFANNKPSRRFRNWRTWPLTNEVRGLIYEGRERVRYRWPLFRSEAKVMLEGIQNFLFPNSLPSFGFQLPMNLHTNACGDFTLLSAADWANLRGYSELEMFSMHLDSLLCHAAHHSGVRERVLRDPMRIYHLDHGVGSGWSPEGEEKLFKRIDTAGIDRLSTEQMYDWAIEMRRNGKPKIFNDESWGLVKEDLPETVIAA